MIHHCTLRVTRRVGSARKCRRGSIGNSSRIANSSSQFRWLEMTMLLPDPIMFSRPSTWNRKQRRTRGTAITRNRRYGRLARALTGSRSAAGIATLAMSFARTLTEGAARNLGRDGSGRRLPLVAPSDAGSPSLDWLPIVSVGSGARAFLAPLVAHAQAPRPAASGRLPPSRASAMGGTAGIRARRGDAAANRRGCAASPGPRAGRLRRLLQRLQGRALGPVEGRHRPSTDWLRTSDGAGDPRVAARWTPIGRRTRDGDIRSGAKPGRDGLLRGVARRQRA